MACPEGVNLEKGWSPIPDTSDVAKLLPFGWMLLTKGCVKLCLQTWDDDQWIKKQTRLLDRFGPLCVSVVCEACR